MIKEFNKRYFFLSNFYERPVEFEGKTYGSNEAAFQAQKAPSYKNRFIVLPPNEAKALGRALPLRKDWEKVKDDIMYRICLAKFTQNPDLAKRLLDTGDEILEEGNTWHDTYWGVDLKTGEGKNVLGSILMRVRNELRIKSNHEVEK